MPRQTDLNCPILRGGVVPDCGKSCTFGYKRLTDDQAEKEAKKTGKPIIMYDCYIRDFFKLGIKFLKPKLSKVDKDVIQVEE